MKGRQDTLGKAWRNKVFTGTHERIEDHRVRIVTLRYTAHTYTNTHTHTHTHGVPEEGYPGSRQL